MAKQDFTVQVTVRVRAGSKDDANQEVTGLMQHAFETSNDEGRFKSYRLDKKQTTPAIPRAKTTAAA
jgi:hypothetical protein